MKRISALPLTVLAALSATALAQPAALPASWNAATLGNATYVVLQPRIEGNANLISPQQQVGLLEALKRDSAGAIQRRYPTAKFTTDLNTPGVIKLTPILTAPPSLTPWAKMSVRLDLDLTDGNRVSLLDSFNVISLWQKGPEAANFAYDQLVKKMP